MCSSANRLATPDTRTGRLMLTWFLRTSDDRAARLCSLSTPCVNVHRIDPCCDRSRRCQLCSALDAPRDDLMMNVVTPYSRNYLEFSTCLDLTFDAHCCHVGTAIEHSVPDRVKPSFVIFDIRALCRSALSVRVPGCQKLQLTA